MGCPGNTLIISPTDWWALTNKKRGALRIRWLYTRQTGGHLPTKKKWSALEIHWLYHLQNGGPLPIKKWGGLGIRWLYPRQTGGLLPTKKWGNLGIRWLYHRQTGGFLPSKKGCHGNTLITYPADWWAPTNKKWGTLGMLVYCIWWLVATSGDWLIHGWILKACQRL